MGGSAAAIAIKVRRGSGGAGRAALVTATTTTSGGGLRRRRHRQWELGWREFGGGVVLVATMAWWCLSCGEVEVIIRCGQ
uniref:Uncharacterized protein n=1 Tax=Oryza nivara TaxID=4536 RepID=A0A0E0J8I7_ORYNI